MRLLIGGLLAGLTMAAGVPDVQSVYLLPMAGGLDQYLANRLTGSQVFRVVTDPKLADAVFTDQLGEAFERKLTGLYPPKIEDDDKDKKDKDDGKPEPRNSTFGLGKGNIFLVDLKSRAVIWSAYEKRNGSRPEMLDRTAVHIVQEIKKQKGK